MYRKLRNSLTALTTCGVALVLTLVGISPLLRSGEPLQLLAVDATPAAYLIDTGPACAQAASCQASLGGLESSVAAPATAPAPLIRNIKSATDTAPTSQHHGRRDNRQPLVMPYFSFAPRG